MTPLGNGRTIYNLVPISAAFSTTSNLSIHVVTPVLVDTVKREGIFGVDVPANAIVAVKGAVNTDAFVLTGSVKEVATNGNQVSIVL